MSSDLYTGTLACPFLLPLLEVSKCDLPTKINSIRVDSVTWIHLKGREKVSNLRIFKGEHFQCIFEFFKNETLRAGNRRQSACPEVQGPEFNVNTHVKKSRLEASPYILSLETQIKGPLRLSSQSSLHSKPQVPVRLCLKN